MSSADAALLDRRERDRLDIGFTQADADRLNAEFAGADARTFLAAMLRRHPGQLAAVSSFGTESAVLLDIIADVAPDTPVIFLETGKHFPETLAYRDELAAHLGLTNVISVEPDPEALAAKDEKGLRWSYDPDGCCEIRKVLPLERALAPYAGSISGRKGFQAATRAYVPHVEVEDGKLKLNPIIDWTKDDIDEAFAKRELPRHPLEGAGYPSIGCAPCTSKVLPGEDPRSGRWRGWEKTECGIHTPLKPGEEPSF